MLVIPSNDTEFLAWIDEHPGGYVVNHHRYPDPAYLKLHRATCGSIRSESRQNYVGESYAKTCAERKAELQEWARREIGGSLSRCGLCHPD